MIDPNSMMGAFTGGQQPADQGQAAVSPEPVAQPDPQPAQPPVQPAAPQPPAPSQTPVQTATPTVPATSSDALDLLESIVNSSGDTPVTPQPEVPVAVEPPAPVPTPVAPTVQPAQASEGAAAQAVLSTIQEVEDPLNPPNPAPASAKENFERPAAPDVASVDAGGAVQHIETERNPEVPVEVEGFLQRVEDFSAQEPQEVVIADGTSEQATTNYPSRPVIVLPITEEEEKAGKKKSPRYSIRWLVEWSHKVIKMFAGKVIYRHTEE